MATETQEAIVDIIAEMRKSDRDEICPWWADGGSCDLCPLGRNGKNCSFSNYADRLEAVHRREMSKNMSKNKADFGQLGDVAKLREALENSNGLLEELAAMGEWGESAREQIAENNAALAEPVRNYEVGTAEEQAEGFILFCLRNSFRGVCNDSCKFAHVNRQLGWQEIGQVRCFPFWAQMPYEEGVNK